MSKQLTITFSDDSVLSALTREAEQTERSADDIVEEALRDWLDSQADSREHSLIQERRASYQAGGGVSLEEVANERGLDS
jgi:hypothetical protein